VHKTYFGIHLYAVGSDRPAAQRMGISVLGTKIVAYALCSIAAAISAIAYIGWIGSAPLTISFNAELDVLTAAALAGVGFSGGRGNVAPTILGAIFLGVVSSLLISLNIGPYYQNIVKGAILFAALLTKSPVP
jgi:ribose/xylose/arabinose/galactoside ABC-type transport system permease subunit